MASFILAFSHYVYPGSKQRLVTCDCTLHQFCSSLFNRLIDAGYLSPSYKGWTVLLSTSAPYDRENLDNTIQYSFDIVYENNAIVWKLRDRLNMLTAHHLVLLQYPQLQEILKPAIFMKILAEMTKSIPPLLQYTPPSARVSSIAENKYHESEYLHSSTDDSDEDSEGEAALAQLRAADGV